MTTDTQLLAWADTFISAWELGYWARVAEENATYPPPKVLHFGRWYDQAAYRQECDRRAIQPWPTDNEVR